MLFVVYLLTLGNLAGGILKKIFAIEYKFSQIILGSFFVFASLGSIGGAAILFVSLSGAIIFCIFLVNALIFLIAYWWIKKSQAVHVEVGGGESGGLFFKKNILRSYAAIFSACIVYGLYLLAQSKTGEALQTPWHTIRSEYVIIFFVSVFSLGLFIFSRLKTWLLLTFLVLQTFLLHSYLPLTHDSFYGADGWRHIANEQRLLDGQGFLEATLADGGSVSRLNSFIGRLSYGNFWFSNVVLAKFFDLDLVSTTKWFLPIVWPLVFPVLLFEIARLLGWSNRKSLFLAWLGLLPFAWQAAGSFTLPVSFGFLVWLSAFLLILKRTSYPHKKQAIVLACIGVSLFFGYTLYFILFWLAWLVAEFLRSNIFGVDKIKFKLSILFVILVMPVLEFFAGYGKFDQTISWLGQVKQVIGNFLGIYIANGPRPHDIATGNIIFNQTPSYAFVTNVFLTSKWLLVVFMVVFFGFVLYGCWYAWKTEIQAVQLLLVFSIGILLSYIITNYFLTGPHILARRLDAVVALGMITLFAYGLFEARKRLNRYAKFAGMAAVLVLSFFITVSYSLGPDAYAVGTSEYQASNHVWFQEKTEEKKCVLGDTYPLLALEAVSRKEIIGGGFPIDANFAQPERVMLFNQIKTLPYYELLEKAAVLTGADHCWLIEKKENFQNQYMLDGDRLSIFGDVVAIRFDLDKK